MEESAACTDLEEIKEEVYAEPEEETRPRTVFTHISEVKTVEQPAHRRRREIKDELAAGEIEEFLESADMDLEGAVIDQEVNQQLLDQFSIHGIRYLAAPSFTGIVRLPATIRLIPFR